MRILLAMIACLCFQTLYAADGPCTSEAHRQFDFWLGEWTAYSEDGEKKLGTNHLKSMMGGCVMQENWQSGNGQYRGTSYNFYSVATGKWHQTWVDNAGGHLFLEGVYHQGAMQLEGKRRDQQGRDVLDRITWTLKEDGRVRQHWQVTADEGKTWQVLFDGYYVRESIEEGQIE